jgi:CyaY protein
MDDSQYQKLADQAFRHITDAFESVDPDVVDCETAGDVVTLTFADRRRCVVNTQRPTRQVWLAANARAWHFSYDEATKTWLDDKGQGLELFATVKKVVQEMGGLEISI